MDLDIFEMVLLVQDLKRIWIGLNDQTQLLVVLEHDKLSSLVRNRVEISLSALRVGRCLGIWINFLLEPQVVDQHRQL